MLQKGFETERLENVSLSFHVSQPKFSLLHQTKVMVFHQRRIKELHVVIDSFHVLGTFGN